MARIGRVEENEAVAAARRTFAREHAKFSILRETDIVDEMCVDYERIGELRCAGSVMSNT